MHAMNPMKKSMCVVLAALAAVSIAAPAEPERMTDADLLEVLPRDIVEGQDLMMFTDQALMTVRRASEAEQRGLLAALEDTVNRSGQAATPSGIEAKNRMGVRWLRLGEDAEAVRLWKDAKASATRPSAASMDTQRLLGQQYMFHGEYEQAAQEFVRGREQFAQVTNRIERSIAFRKYLDVSGKLAELYDLRGREQDAFDIRRELLEEHIERMSDEYKRGFRMKNARTLAGWNRFDEALAEMKVSQGESPEFWTPAQRFEFELQLLIRMRPHLSAAELVERHEEMLARPEAAAPESLLRALSLRTVLASNYRLLGRDDAAIRQAQIILEDSAPLLKSQSLAPGHRDNIDTACRFAHDLLDWYDKMRR